MKKRLLAKHQMTKVFGREVKIGNPEENAYVADVMERNMEELKGWDPKEKEIFYDLQGCLQRYRQMIEGRNKSASPKIRNALFHNIEEKIRFFKEKSEFEVNILGDKKAGLTVFIKKQFPLTLTISSSLSDLKELCSNLEAALKTVQPTIEYKDESLSNHNLSEESTTTNHSLLITFSRQRETERDFTDERFLSEADPETGERFYNFRNF